MAVKLVLFRAMTKGIYMMRHIENIPYSGLGFMLHHAHEDNPECPIASYECDGGILGGVYIYDTEEQAVEAWNRRVNDG